ncbi:probable ATP-dependent RNA helicase DHX35 isoform X2 [Choristoneura fumiferana]|uniref:probable ATP-dependent RNA helicase DHX35 isoform X2 n=1 Tax=Choristoneura fumiferana TaxID=7141 RepID=UPI003D154E57
MAELPLRPMCAKMLCNSGEYGCVDEALAIASMLQVDGIFTKNATGKDNIAARVSRRNNFEACDIRESLEKLVKRKFGIENKTFEGFDLGTEKCKRVMKCVLSGFFPQAAHLSTDSTYRGIRGAVLHISPDSCLYRVQQPKWVVFASVQSTGDKTYMRDMMTIDKEWLLEIAPHYYKQS